MKERIRRIFLKKEETFFPHGKEYPEGVGGGDPQREEKRKGGGGFLGGGWGVEEKGKWFLFSTNKEEEEGGLFLEKKHLFPILPLCGQEGGKRKENLFLFSLKGAAFHRKKTSFLSPSGQKESLSPRGESRSATFEGKLPQEKEGSPPKGGNRGL